MNGSFRRSLFPIFVLIVLIGSVALANEISNDKRGIVVGSVGRNEAAIGIGSALGEPNISGTTGGRIVAGPNASGYVYSSDVYYLGPTAKANKSASNTPGLGHRVINATIIGEGYGWYTGHVTVDPHGANANAS